MNNKLKRINLDNIKSKLKDHVQISDGMKKKLEDAKQYYIDLGHDLKELGNDILNGFLRNKFLMAACLLGIIDMGVLGYLSKHENPTLERQPLVIERQSEYSVDGIKPKLVAEEEVADFLRYFEVAKCKDLRKNYYKTISKTLNGEFYKTAGLFDDEDTVVHKFGDMINAFNENTQNLKYNYAAVINESMGKVSKERIQEMLCGEIKDMNDSEKALSVQLKVYDYLDKQLKVRSSGSLEDLQEQDVLMKHFDKLPIFPNEEDKYNHIAYKNMMKFGGQGIKQCAKNMPVSKKYLGSDDCLAVALVEEMLQQNILNVQLDRLLRRGHDKGVILKKAQKYVDRSVGKDVSEHFDIYANVQRENMNDINDNILSYEK